MEVDWVYSNAVMRSHLQEKLQKLSLGFVKVVLGLQSGVQHF